MTYVPTQGKCPVCHHDNTMTPAEQVGMAAMSGFEQLQQQLAAEQLNNAKLLDFIARAPVSSGVCCCGDTIDGHASPMICGHSPVDMWDHAVRGLLDTKPDDAALREWGARLLRSAAAKQGWKSDEVALKALADQLLSGDWKPELEAK